MDGEDGSEPTGARIRGIALLQRTAPPQPRHSAPSDRCRLAPNSENPGGHKLLICLGFRSQKFNKLSYGLMAKFIVLIGQSNATGVGQLTPLHRNSLVPVHEPAAPRPPPPPPSVPTY